MTLKMRLLFLLIITFYVCTLASFGQNQVKVWAGNGPTGTTSLTAANSGTAATVTLTAPSSEVTILCAPGGSNCYFTVNGTATTSNFEIPAGYAFTYEFFPAISSLSIISDGTSGTHSVFAH